jgi:hypothetical protein
MRCFWDDLWRSSYWSRHYWAVSAAGSRSRSCDLVGSMYDMTASFAAWGPRFLNGDASRGQSMPSVRVIDPQSRITRRHESIHTCTPLSQLRRHTELSRREPMCIPEECQKDHHTRGCLSMVRFSHYTSNTRLQQVTPASALASSESSTVTVRMPARTRCRRVRLNLAG